MIKNFNIPRFMIYASIYNVYIFNAPKMYVNFSSNIIESSINKHWFDGKCYYNKNIDGYMLEGSNASVEVSEEIQNALSNEDEVTR